MEIFEDKEGDFIKKVKSSGGGMQLADKGSFPPFGQGSSSFLGDGT